MMKPNITPEILKKLTKEQKEAVTDHNGNIIYKDVALCINCKKWFGRDRKKYEMCGKCDHNIKSLAMREANERRREKKEGIKRMFPEKE